MSEFIELGCVADIYLSNIDKKSKDNEQKIKLCNFVDVYYNWAINHDVSEKFLEATANENQIKKFMLKKGQVAITKDSETRYDIGVSTYIADDFQDTLLGYHCALIKPEQDRLNGKYLNAYLHSPTAIKHFSNQAGGSGQRYTLTQDIIASLPIPIVDYEKQKLIGNFFSYIDRRILLNNKIISELESMAKTIYDYWFLQFDFPDENGKPYKSSGGKMVWNEELKREIPEGWSVTTIGDITDCFDSLRIPLSSQERALKKGNIPYYGATGIMGYVNEALFDGDYVLMAEDGSIMDDNYRPVLQRVSGSFWVNNHTHILSPKNGYGCKLLMMLLKDVYVPKIKTGSVQAKITQENMNNIVVVDVPDELKKKINFILDLIDRKVLFTQVENQELASLRDFLLPMLMNGQVTFKDLK